MTPHKYLKGLFSNQLYYIQETDSVLDDALALCTNFLAQNKLGEDLLYSDTLTGTTIMSEYQRKGRGQRDKPWIAPPKSALLLACIFNKATLLQYNAEILQPAQLTLCMANAIALTITELLLERALKQHSIVLGIKWPNDVLINNCKIAGILTEVHKDWILVGTGINLAYEPITEAVNNAVEQIIPHIEKVQEKEALTGNYIAPTALDYYGINISAEQLYKKLLTNYEQIILQPFEKTLAWINSRLWKRNKEVYYQTHEAEMSTTVYNNFLNTSGNISTRQSVCKGTISRINWDGSLTLLVDKESEHTLHSGSIKL